MPTNSTRPAKQAALTAPSVGGRTASQLSHKAPRLHTQDELQPLLGVMMVPKVLGRGAEGHDVGRTPIQPGQRGHRWVLRPKVEKDKVRERERGVQATGPDF